MFDKTDPDPVGFTFSVNGDQDFTGGEVVPFTNERTNLGNHYDPSTSKFRCPFDGTYLFSVSVVSQPGKRMQAQIVKDGAILVRANADDGPTDNIYNQGSAFVITECAVGQMVWVRAYDTVYLRAGLASHFSGYMLERY